MVRSQALKTRSLGRRQAESGETFTVKLVAVGGLMIIAATAVLSSTMVGSGATQPTSLLETMPRSLLAEIGEQSKSIQGILSSVAGASSPSPGRYPPFSCAKLLQDLKTDPVTLNIDPNRGKIHSRRTQLRNRDGPNFYISLHNSTFDRTRWEIMKEGWYYEYELTNAFLEVLQASPPGSRVLDVGGNIGFFSLLSAAAGNVVIDTFEPNLKNRMRYCESLNLNRWFHTEFDPPSELANSNPKNNLYPYGVGAEEGMFVFEEHSNPGQGAFTSTKAGASNPNAMQIVTLDGFARERGWFESRPDIAIFKVDVEGHENKVIEGGRELLQSRIIRNIFMEISVRDKAETQANVPLLEFLAGPAGYKLHKVGGWMGPVDDWTQPNDAQMVSKILEAAAKEGAKQLNLWWKLPEQTTTSG